MLKYFKKSLSLAIKIILLLFLETVIFFYITRHLGGIHLPDLPTTLLVIISLLIVNSIIWPVMINISLRFIVFTLGFGTFLLDGLVLYAISALIPEVSIGGFALFSIPLLYGLISSFVSLLVGFEESSSYYTYLLKRELQPTEDIDKPGYIFLEIDGLAHDILLEAVDKGKMPYLKECLDEKTHKLTKWETDLSSQTSSSQAGILHGNNTNIPAFRWVEKENNNKIVSSNALYDANNIEKRISDGKGLLSDMGASRSNLFSGDAEDYMLTYSKFSKLSDFYTKTWYHLYFYPFIMAKILLLFLFDMFLELLSRIVHFVKNIKPRISRGLFYYVARSGANVVMREATTFAIIGDIYACKYNVVYATYMGYDEIAHHSGIRDYDSFYALTSIDKQLRRLDKAIKNSKRDYKMIVLSDHGQSGGPTFKQKYSVTLDDLVKDCLPENITVHSILHTNDDHFANKFSLKGRGEAITERLDDTRERFDEGLDNTRKKLSGLVNRVRDEEIIDDIRDRGTVLKQEGPVIERLQNVLDDYNMDLDLPEDEIVSEETAQTIVLASGNLGLIYFTDWSDRLSYEQMEDAFPNLIKALSSHEGIGFVMVRSSILGTIVLSDDNVYYMDTDTYDGDDFLEVYGENVVEHLKRTDSFEHVPDILVNSSYDPDTGEVYAFEELIGSHGGVGGTQQEPFILYPSEWNLTGNIVGAENVHKFFKKEIKKGLDD